MPVRQGTVQVNVADAKARFSELVRKAMSGVEIVIARDNRPVVRLVRVEPPPRRRRPGSARGRVWIAPDFDDTPSDFRKYT